MRTASKAFPRERLFGNHKQKKKKTKCNDMEKNKKRKPHDCDLNSTAFLINRAMYIYILSASAKYPEWVKETIKESKWNTS